MILSFVNFYLRFIPKEEGGGRPDKLTKAPRRVNLNILKRQSCKIFQKDILQNFSKQNLLKIICLQGKSDNWMVNSSEDKAEAARIARLLQFLLIFGDL